MNMPKRPMKVGRTSISHIVQQGRSREPGHLVELIRAGEFTTVQQNQIISQMPLAKQAEIRRRLGL